MSDPKSHLLLQWYLEGHLWVFWSCYMSPSQARGFRASWSASAITDRCPSLLPVVPMLAQIPVVTDCYWDEV